MSENWQEVFQMGEWVGLFTFISIGLFYIWGGQRTDMRNHYRQIMVVSILVYAVCAFILRVLDI